MEQSGRKTEGKQEIKQGKTRLFANCQKTTKKK